MSRAWNLDAPAPRPPPRGPAWEGPPADDPPQAQPGWPTSVGYALAGLLVLGVMFASFNPSFGFFLPQRGFDARRWPWELFGSPHGFMLRWFPPQAFLIAMTLSGLALVLCAFLRPSRTRAGLALAAFVLVAGTLVAAPGDYLIVTGGNIAFALLTAGVLCASARPCPAGARRLLCASALATFVFAFLPLHDATPAEDDPLASRPYQSLATLTIQGLTGVLSEHPPTVVDEGGSQRKLGLLDWARGNLVTLPMLLGLVVALFVLLGLGRPWAPLVMGLLLLTAVLGPAFDHATRALAEARLDATHKVEGALSSADALATVARNSAEVLLTVLRIALLPLALGLAELMRVDRRPPA